MPLPAVRCRIWDQAIELTAANDDRDIPAVLANRFKLPRGVIVRTLVLEGVKHERAAATFRTAITNALTMAKETEQEIDSEFSEVA